MRMALIGMVVLMVGFGFPHAAQGQSDHWALKIDPVSFIQRSISIEGEVFVNDQTSLLLRGGAIGVGANGKALDGWFLKGSYRHYFPVSESLPTGWFFQGSIMYSSWFNSLRSGSGRFRDVSETSMGGLIEFGYSWSIYNRFRIEPWLGVGMVPTWTSYSYLNDTPPFEASEVKWQRLGGSEIEQPPVSHLPVNISFPLALSGGLNVGIIF